MRHAYDIEEKAARWLSRRDAGLALREEGEFTAWLAEDPRHRAAYLRLAAAWERSARLSRLRPQDATVDPDLLAPMTRSFFDRWRLPLAVAAGLACVAAFGAWWALGSAGTHTYRTDVGGLSRVVLRDGSAVTLNTDTDLRVHFTGGRRNVDLLRGEAQFQVAHDRSRPFEVKAAGRIVRAVGTAFDVRVESPQSLEVTVTEGRVAVVGASDRYAGTEAPTTISAGESAITRGAKVTVHPL